MNCQRSIDCPRCGSTMTFRKFFDYGGHSWGWECIVCKQIIDHGPEFHRLPNGDWYEREKRRSGKEWG